MTLDMVLELVAMFRRGRDIPPRREWIRRLARDSAAQVAAFLTNTFQDNTALVAPDTIMDIQPIPALHISADRKDRKDRKDREDPIRRAIRACNQVK